MEPNGSSPQPLLQVRDLKTHFFTRSGVVKAVNGVSFDVMPGETLGLVGESGSGKTITVTSILKLLPRGARILDGEIIFEGENLIHKTEKEMAEVRGKRIGLILQNSMTALDPVFTIGTQIAEPLVVHKKMSWTESFRGAIDLLRMVKIGAPEIRIHNFPHELSGGMRQRSASAAAIGPTPSLLIADEPTTALDVTTQRQYLELLKELQAKTGVAVIFITHDMSIVGNLCDRIAVFYGGHVVETGGKEQIFNQPSHPYTQALLNAIPVLGEKVDRLQSVDGEPPNPRHLPDGCPFHPRCREAVDTCLSGEPPPIFQLQDGRQVRCWLREDNHA
ncbi:MAG: ABC transporter ATP-binding protein [Candidatus Tectomicrobia bacterium]|nr:ABC transporter ATP-binding protein [Candidatus Tectomicrobia bacterium]